MLFTAIILIAVVYLIIYILLSVPAVQNRLKDIACKEASAFLGTDVEMEQLTVKPFNEVVVSGLSVADKDGKRCLSVETVGAGINLWRLINDRKIELTYAEIIGLDAEISQPREGAPLNIQFIIDAFKPKDKKKPPTQFDIKLRNVVLRRCAVGFSRLWKPAGTDASKTDFNHFRVSDLRADLNLPQLKNNDFIIDLRRLSFNLSGGLQVDKIALRTHITDHSLSVVNLVVELPGTELRPSDFAFNFNGFSNLADAFKSGTHRIDIIDGRLSLPDLGFLYPRFRKYPDPIELTLEAEGNMDYISLPRLSALSDGNLRLELKGSLDNPVHPDKARFAVDEFLLESSAYMAGELAALLPPSAGKGAGILSRAAPFRIEAEGRGDVGDGNYSADLSFTTACGSLALEGEGRGVRRGGGRLKAVLTSEGFDIGTLLGENRLGNVALDAEFDGNVAGKDIDGILKADVAEFVFNGVQMGGLTVDASKKGKDIQAELTADNAVAGADATAAIHLEGKESALEVHADVRHFYPSAVGLLPRYPGYCLKGTVDADLRGNNPDNTEGELRVTDFSFEKPGEKGIAMSALSLKSEFGEEGRTITLASDWVDGRVSGDFRIAELPKEATYMLSEALPSLITYGGGKTDFTSDALFDFTLHPVNTLTEFFNLPVRLLVPVKIEGGISGTDNMARLTLDAPYLQQGRNKLLRDNRLTFDIDGTDGTFALTAASTFPTKKGDTSLDARIWGVRDEVMADLDWITPENPDFKGALKLGAMLGKNEFSAKPEVTLDVYPSSFDVGSAKWHVEKSRVEYKDKILNVDGLRIWHDRQFVEIEGVASSSSDDVMTVRLADIDVDYIFDTLNINYVTFGGTATGDVYAAGVFGKQPEAHTDNLFIKDMSYNGAVLGDGALRSRWLNDAKEVAITADITHGGRRRAVIDGGVWVTRDSLSFAIDADRVPVDFLAPFMKAFTSDVKGYASGQAKLFGTFSDIDLTGRLLADSLTMKLDYTNTYYHGTDSVYLDPGKISIPSFRLYDRNGNSAILTGELRHNYFHDPRFTFRLSDARNLLCYDTNPRLNPDWYGTIYGNGSAVVRGWPGIVSVAVDMSIVGSSAFTFVLNETQAAEDYHFLTFSDRRKEAMEAAADTVPDVLAAFRKKMESGNDAPSNFMLDLRATVSPSALLTLVMDPVAGDKITARGNGAMQLEYESESDEMQMFGKYVLEEGNYNFSLQDLILKDFTIRQGSSISFNGDPMNALLDITASYRVNTNLSDLDKSFSTDRDLTRTNVPVDALLMVKGEMQHPDITFDIELPTLTQDVVRKVKSIISTDDMMSRQIIYLLALNRFYTPEYMGTQSNGGELAAVASSTLSSQLTNIIGQLTDKFTLAPSFRSDKGDFSDVEFDVALSSRLLNNRLLINGNFGYRDRSTSTTTFVGDFDIEYLLNRSGNLRLKAYNHFNDQNYYLREALTTQGLGVVYRRDFDDPFSFLRPRKRKKADENKVIAKPDSVAPAKEEGPAQ